MYAVTGLIRWHTLTWLSIIKDLMDGIKSPAGTAGDTDRTDGNMIHAKTG